MPTWAPTSGATSSMIIWPTSPRSRWPCSRPPMRARLESSQPCSAFSAVVSRRAAIIWLMLSLSSATSPERRDVDLLGEVAAGHGGRHRGDRAELGGEGAGQLVDALGQVRQVPDTPRTCACPPSLPSVPTSRATRVTSSAKEESWSTIVLTVDFSSRISPRRPR